jgi:hypothetical protein
VCPVHEQGKVGIDKPAQLVAQGLPRVAQPTQGGSATPHRKGKATSSFYAHVKPKKKVSFKAGTLETKEFNLGHTKQVFLSTKGSSTSTKFEFLFCVEEQQQGGGDCQICWQQ